MLDYTTSEKAEILNFFATRLNKLGEDVSCSESFCDARSGHAREDHPAIFHNGTAYYLCDDQIWSTRLGHDVFVTERESVATDADYYLAMQHFLANLFKAAL